MRNKIIYSFILVFMISLISSAKKASVCTAGSCCKASKQKSIEIREKDENKREAASLSLFYFNI